MISFSKLFLNVKVLNGNIYSKCNVIPLLLVTQNRDYAARKGTREKAKKKKVKVEVKKVGFIPHNQRGLDKLQNRPKRKFDDSWKRIATDNVYPTRYYRWPVYPFLEAVECHRQTHHPTMCNVPNAPLNVIIELNMEAEKKNRFMDTFYRVIAIPHSFDHGEERNIIAFTKDVHMQEQVRNAGASLAGGIELIKQVQTGDIALKDFEYIVAHPNILPELVSLRGLMKRKFPNAKSGSLGVDMLEMVRRFFHGINYTGFKDEYEPDFGIIETSIGNLSMEPKHLEGNFEALIKDVNSVKPKKSGAFIRRCILVSPPTSERFKIDHHVYIPEEKLESNDDVDDDNDEEEDEVRLSA